MRVREVEQILAIMPILEPLSLEMQIGDMEEKKLSDFQKSDLPSPDEVVLAREAVQIVRECVATSLSPREAYIIKMRYGFEGRNEHTLEEIAVLLGLSRERIRQCQGAAEAKIRNRLAERHVRFCELFQ